jgi:histidinol-phosphate aminotransferase
VIDEAYIEFLNSPADFVSEIRSGKRPNILLMRTFSKIFGLAGLRLGYGIAQPEIITTLEKLRQPFNVNSIAQAGALAAVDDAGHVQRTRENNALGLSFYTNEFLHFGLEFIPSAANFVLVRVGDGQHVFEQMQKLGVIVRPMSGYQLPEWIRISIGTPDENERCCDTLRKVLGK